MKAAELRSLASGACPITQNQFTETKLFKMRNRILAALVGALICATVTAFAEPPPNCVTDSKNTPA